MGRGGGGIIVSAEGTSLVGGSGVSSFRKFLDLEALKRYFQPCHEKKIDLN